MSKTTFQIKSILEEIAPQVFRERNTEAAKKLFINHVSGTNVKDKDLMINTVAKFNKINDVHKYLANALLKFEGLSTKSY